MRHVAAVGLAILLAGVGVSPSMGQWVEAPGTGWAQLQIAHQRTQTGFGRMGTVVPLDELDPDAQSVITTARFTGALGLFRGVDAWVDVPLHRQSFEGSGSDLRTTGLGDPRLFLRAGPSAFGLGADALPLAVAVRGGVKLPTGTFENDAETIALSQGQRDWSLLLEVGKSLYPVPMYVSGWVGHRWRTENEEIARDPGNEWVFNTALGGSWGRFRWKLAVDGVFGRPSVDTRTGFEFAARELVQVIPTVGWSVGPGALQASTRIPVHGQSTRSDRLPASPTVTLGYFLSWTEPLW